MSENETEVDLDLIAQHEAGHAVMAWLFGLPASELTVDDHGGFYAGTDRQIEGSAAVLITLAGFAVESGYGIGGPLELSECQGRDFDEARSIIERAPWLFPTTQSVDKAIIDYFEDACNALLPHAELIEAIGERLADEKRLSARTVAAMLRKHNWKKRSGTTAC